MVEVVAEHMGFTKKSIKKAKEKNAQMEEEMESKKPKTELVPSQAKPKETKSPPTPVKSSTIQSSSGKGVLKHKEKTKRTYVVVYPIASEIESDEESKESQEERRIFPSDQETTARWCPTKQEDKI